MTLCAHYRLPSWWPLALAASLSLAPGCSVHPEPREDFVPFWDSRGIVSYQYVPRNPPATEAPTAASSASQDAWQRQQELAEAADRRRMDVLAYQDMRRELEDQRRRARQEEDAYRDSWWQNRREQRLQEQGRYRAHLQQSSQWFEGQRLRAAAESARWREVSMTIDALLQNQR
jgi:hypothetical protein